MKILGDRVLVKRIEAQAKEGFETVDVQDDFVFKGEVVAVGERKVTMHAAPVLSSTSGGTNTVPPLPVPNVGDTVLFAKYSPDTHEIQHEGQTMKIVACADVLAII